jgi:hypothetical protein
MSSEFSLSCQKRFEDLELKIKCATLLKFHEQRNFTVYKKHLKKKKVFKVLLKACTWHLRLKLKLLNKKRSINSSDMTLIADWIGIILKCTLQETNVAPEFEWRDYLNFTRYRISANASDFSMVSLHAMEICEKLKISSCHRGNTFTFKFETLGVLCDCEHFNTFEDLNCIFSTFKHVISTPDDMIFLTIIRKKHEAFIKNHQQNYINFVSHVSGDYKDVFIQALNFISTVWKFIEARQWKIDEIKLWFHQILQFIDLKENSFLLFLNSDIDYISDTTKKTLQEKLENDLQELSIYQIVLLYTSTDIFSPILLKKYITEQTEKILYDNSIEKIKLFELVVMK